MAANALIMGRRAISPWLEMGAYEFLWTQAGQTFKRLADKFRGTTSLPSDFVLRGIAEECAKEAKSLLHKGNVERFGIRINGSGDYPDHLRDARYPVELLYFQGWWDLVESPSVAVVGTRTPSERGIARAQKLARSLVGDGYTVVSGLAAGIDTAVHRTAVESGGRTIAVIGTPLSMAYPKENSSLQALIAREHLLVSQVPIVHHSRQRWYENRSFFPQRNVTMSALTQATIIVEASDTSGTLMQARAAIQQKRRLFILDSCFENPALTWPRRYEAEGAIRVKEYEDIREHLGKASPD
jgi:DNA processing protein